MLTIWGLSVTIWKGGGGKMILLAEYCTSRHLLYKLKENTLNSYKNSEAKVPALWPDVHLSVSPLPCCTHHMIVDFGEKIQAC